MKKSIKYRVLLGLSKCIGLKKFMTLPQKTKMPLMKALNGTVHLSRLAKEGVSSFEVRGSHVYEIKANEESKRLVIYLIGGGMFSSPTDKIIERCVEMANKCKVNVYLPAYPTLYDGHTLLDVYDMVYTLYKQALKKYDAADIYLAGVSSGGNLALGLISYINEMQEHLQLPAKVYCSSPGTLLMSEEEYTKARTLEGRDVIMSVKATEGIWESMCGGKEVPAYMKHLQVGDYTGLKDVYLNFGGDEVFLAGKDGIVKQLEAYGVHVEVEIGEGMYHAYAMIPLVNDALKSYERFLNYISR